MGFIVFQIIYYDIIGTLRPGYLTTDRLFPTQSQEAATIFKREILAGRILQLEHLSEVVLNAFIKFEFQHDGGGSFTGKVIVFTDKDGKLDQIMQRFKNGNPNCELNGFPMFVGTHDCCNAIWLIGVLVPIIMYLAERFLDIMREIFFGKVERICGGFCFTLHLFIFGVVRPDGSVILNKSLQFEDFLIELFGSHSISQHIFPSNDLPYREVNSGISWRNHRRHI